MASKKKDFSAIQNPAMQFISTPTEPTADQAPIEKVMAPVKAPEGYRINYLYVETKSKQLKLTVQPSLYERVKKAAANNGLSMNEYINQLLQAATKEE